MNCHRGSSKIDAVLALETMALFAQRDLSVPLPARFLQLSIRHEQQMVSDDEFSMQQPWLRSPIQCTEAADVEAINFSIEEVNYVGEKSEIVCNK